ncbi:MAG: dephospho-CoA kinase [Phycisphaeraceae bacterium]|nr:dephospho-CoA kinase [Phycisphaeraceae bacterium]
MPKQQKTTPQRLKPVIGLLGGPGSGKSTAAGLFAELGCAVIDADQLAHDVLLNDAVKDQVRERWGGVVFDEAGQIKRSALGGIVFADPAALRALEAIIHPRVHDGRRIERQQHQADPEVMAIVEDCPLLLESDLNKQCDVLVMIDAPDELRLERVRATRGWDAEELKKRDQQQIPLDTKRQAAEYVICNDQGLAHMREQVRHVLQSITHQTPS